MKASQLPPHPRVLELGFVPLLAKQFPDRTKWISTAFRWSDVRTYQRQQSSSLQRLFRLITQFIEGLRAAWKQDYDVVVTRCLGSVNSHGSNILIHWLRSSLGLILQSLALFASRGSRIKLVVIDFTDHVSIHPRDGKLFWKCDLYFKRELAHNLWQSLENVVPRGACSGSTQNTELGGIFANKLRPFSLGYTNEELPQAIPANEKTIDIFYSGSGDHIPGRRVLTEVLEKLRQKGWRVDCGDGKLNREEFQNKLAQSRLCLSPAGIGWDCYRHYEIIAAGSVPLMEYRAIRQHAPYLQDEETFYYDPQGDIVAQLHELLSTPDSKLDQMVTNARKKLLSSHTFSALANYVMSEIRLLTS